MQRVVWSSWAEWRALYADLFALDDDVRRRAGVQRVATWRSRGRVPHAVEATCSLAELALADAADAASPHALALTYAMALTRLVNGVVDPLQQKAHAASVHQLALEQGLPASLVDVRHECTHNRLPSLPTLRLGAEQALLWLHERYWLPQLAALRAPAAAAAAAPANVLAPVETVPLAPGGPGRATSGEAQAAPREDAQGVEGGGAALQAEAPEAPQEERCREGRAAVNKNSYYFRARRLYSERRFWILSHARDASLAS